MGIGHRWEGMGDTLVWWGRRERGYFDGGGTLPWPSTTQCSVGGGLSVATEGGIRVDMGRTHHGDHSRIRVGRKGVLMSRDAAEVGL